jgi:aliphatic glucosinolate S-oxygenase
MGIRALQAIVGAGVAGLIAARELQREGHRVEVFEKQAHVGGVWVIDERTESDVLGQDKERTKVHSSLYQSLRVNLPRELMSISDFPFLPEHMQV